jgi:hypothetical protein
MGGSHENRCEPGADRYRRDLEIRGNNAPPQRCDLSIIGIIGMVVVAVGLFISLALMTTRRRTDVTDRRDGATYVEPAHWTGSSEPFASRSTDQPHEDGR